MKEKKKSLLKYAGEISSPVIKQDDIKKWESDAVKTVNDHFSQRFNEIKKEYSKLIEEFQWNDLVYKSNYSFKPIQGKIYHLYQRDDEKKSLFLSLISPKEWNMLFIGSFKLLSNNKWEKIDE
tara:strand:- start:1080 stop:1448 length:369 start_codon:yes stop_codon:yes gene_type:complete